MDKNSKLPDKPQQPTRFIIIPLKPHLAKYIIFRDWKKLNHPDEVHNFTFKYFFAENRLSGFEQTMIDYLSQLIGEKVSERNPNFTYSIYKGRLAVNNELKLFGETKGYTFVKISFNVVYGTIPERRKQTIIEAANSINWHLEYSFRRFLRVFSNGQTPNQSLDQIYNVLGISDAEIKKATLTKYCYRHR